MENIKNKCTFQEQKSLIYTDIMLNEFDAFIKHDTIGRVRYLRENGIEYINTYKAKYNKIDNTAVFLNLDNPFTGRPLVARFDAKQKGLKDGEVMGVRLTNIGISGGNLTPEDFFWCALSDDSRFNSSKYDGVPIFSNKRNEVERNSKQKKRRESGSKLREDTNHKYLNNNKSRHFSDMEIKEERRKELQPQIEKYGVTELVHFTKVANLPSILQNGLMPIEMMDTMGIDYCNNDIGRNDHCEDCISISIEIPNFKLFRRFCEISKNNNWVFLVFDAKLLYEQENYYSYHNAATNQISNRIRLMNSVSHFEKMFADEIRVSTMMGDQLFNRAVGGLKPNHTTSPQAEILVKGRIDLKFFKRASFVCKEDYLKYKDILIENNIESNYGEFFKIHFII